jgi:hypothetical protein
MSRTIWVAPPSAAVGAADAQIADPAKVGAVGP